MTGGVSRNEENVLPASYPVSGGGLLHGRNIRTDGIITEEEYNTIVNMSQPIAEKISRIDTGNGFLLDGERICCEAMADLEGIRLMLDLAEKEEKFDYDIFFGSFAKLWFCYERGAQRSSAQ